MSSIAERVYEIMQGLPEDKAAEILDFAEFVKARENQNESDFFSMAGLWEGRNIDQAQLRKQAWPDRQA
jgi:hypothetical protein